VEEAGATARRYNVIPAMVLHWAKRW